MEKLKHFRDLRVYQAGLDAAIEIFNLTRQFPMEERFALTDQMRRASRSVCAGLAEAWRRRRYAAAFVAKLNESEAEAAEMQVHLELALHAGYIDQATFDRLDNIYDHILGQLVRMIEQPEKWVLKKRASAVAGDTSRRPSEAPR